MTAGLARLAGDLLVCLQAWKTSAIDPRIRGEGTSVRSGEAAASVSPTLLSAGRCNSKSLSFSLLLEEVLVEDGLPGLLCQGKAA